MSSAIKLALRRATTRSVCTTKIAKVYVYLVQTPFYPVETLVHLVETLNHCPVDFSLFTA